MSGIAEIIDTLEIKIEKLFSKIDSLEENNKILRAELKNAVLSNKNHLEEIASLKKEQETLKMANSLLGSEDYKRDTKLKINSIIREIDYCIAQLSD